MTGTKDLFKVIYSKENLRRAFYNAKKGKGWYDEIIIVENNLDYYLDELQRMLKDKTYHTSEYEKFYRKEGNKIREIYKLPFYPDRIAQWAVLQVIEPFIIANMTKDTYSAIPGRGIQPIVNDLKGYTKVTKVNGKKVETYIPSILVTDEIGTQYCYKIDIHHYYQSINHEILKQKYRKLFKDPDLLWIIDEIIDSVATANIEDLSCIYLLEEDYDLETGIPIGNYMSQYCGNFYLSSFDHWIKEVMKVKHYYRYMDDIVIFGETKEELKALHESITTYLRDNLKLSIKPNYQIFPSKVRGVDFVGYRFFGEYTLLRKSTALNMMRKMRGYTKKRDQDLQPTYSEWCGFNSYKGFLQNCDSFRLWKAYVEPLIDYMKAYYEKEVKNNDSLRKCVLNSGYC